MTLDPILLLGGSGAIGRLSAAAIRSVHPDAPLLIGGRDLAKSRGVADALGGAEGVVIDPMADDLGLGDRKVSAVAVFYTDDRLAGMTYAQRQGVPHLGISSGIYEIAPEVATFMNRPDAAAIVLGYEWLVGATTVAALTCAAAFQRVHDITMGALVDEEDQGGPAVEEDFERLSKMMPQAFTRRDGAYIWRSEADAKAVFHAIDGTPIEAAGFSSIDVAGLSAATGAKDVAFNIATAVSSTRRQGKPKSTEIIIEMTGEAMGGEPLRTRHAVFHPGGAAPLTALGVSMILERLTGLDGEPAQAPGLYFPYQVINHAAYLTRLKAAGGDLIALDAS